VAAGSYREVTPPGSDGGLDRGSYREVTTSGVGGWVAEDIHRVEP